MKTKEQIEAKIKELEDLKNGLSEYFFLEIRKDLEEKINILKWVIE
jgi:hypothetical protein